MRLAVLVALDGYESDGPAAPEEVDPWLHGALARLGFGVASSLEDVPPAATLLVHVVGRVEQAVASLRSLADRVAERAPESALFLAELTHDGPPDESLVAAEHVEAVREALGARERGFAALVAVRPDAALEDSFAFSRLVVRAAEDAEDARSARLSEVVERLGAMPERHAVAQGYAHVLGGVDFELGRNEGPAFVPLLALADGARDAHEWDHAIAGYRAALLVARRTKERASVYARIGAAERGRGELHEAKRAYEKARGLVHDDAATLYALVGLSHDLGDWKRYVTLAREQVAHLDGTSEKVDLLFAIARALGQQLRDLPGAVVELEKARQLEPLRDDVLEALRRAYRVLGEWKKLIEITGVLADEGPSDAERSARRLAQARIALDKLGDGQLGIAFLDAALTEDPTNDEALDLLVEVRTSRGEVAQLGRALTELAERYDEMGDAERAKDARRCIEGLPSVRDVSEISRVVGVPPSLHSVDVLSPDESDGMEAAPSSADSTGPMNALPPTLEELPPDSLLDYEEPAEGSSSPVDLLPEPVVEIASHTSPAGPPPDLSEPGLDLPIFVAGETGLHAAIANPDAVTIPTPSGPVDDDNALLELEEAVARTPLDASLHARLFALHTAAGRGDRAFLSALALEELGAADEEHEAALDQSRPEGALRMRALLDTPAWEALRAPGSDDVVESLFGAVSSAAIAAQIDDRRMRRKLIALDAEKKQSSTSTVSIVASFQWAARVLGVACPDLYLLDEVPGDIAAVPSAEPSTAIGPGVLSGIATKEVAFLASRHLAYYRREHAPLLHFSSLQELTLLVLACVQLELPGVPIPQSVATSVASLRSRISRHVTESDRTSIAAAVERLESRGGRLDLAAWVRSVELTSVRAGLFLCGDLRSAMARLRRERAATSAATFDEIRADLLGFTVSRAHAELRAEFALLATARSSGLRSRDELALPPAGEARAS